MLHFSAPSSMWASVNVKCVYVSVAGCHPTHSSVSLTRTHSPSFFFCAVSSLPCSFTWFRLIFIDYFLLVCECVCMCAWVCECVCVYFLAVNVNLWVSGGSYACLQTPRPIAARLHSFVLEHDGVRTSCNFSSLKWHWQEISILKISCNPDSSNPDVQTERAFWDKKKLYLEMSQSRLSIGTRIILISRLAPRDKILADNSISHCYIACRLHLSEMRTF